MNFTEKQKNGFFDAVESMKKYRRADLIDEKGRDLLEKLYVDLLPNEHILKKTLLNNTTFLIGRKGTGKSTIFLRIEQELRKKDTYLSCYIDVKTIYEASQSQYKDSDYIRDLIPDDLIDKYLIERTFIQNILSAIQYELNKKYDSMGGRIAKIFVKTKPEIVKKKIQELEEKIKNNQLLESIEIPILRKINERSKISQEKFKDTEAKIAGLGIAGEIKANALGGEIKTDSGFSFKKGNKDTSEFEKGFSSVFLQVFQIKEIIVQIKEILALLNIDHLFVLLDDFSEIDDDAISRFVDVVLSPLNNWSDEFVKFKVAAYPGRLYYGKIDPGKIDTIYLDFYDLYSEFDRNKMEVNAIGFVERLIESRINYFAEASPEIFFDTSSQYMEIEEYYELFFKVSMNVPRILGYILSYCYQSKVIYNKQINKTDIESAAERYYEDKIEPFFDTATFSLLSIDEKISILQFRELLDKITSKLLEVRKKIVTKELKGSVYDPSSPYASHFYLDPRLEEFLKTLELNFFISKYNDLSDKDGNPSSIYNINYGLAINNNILWGKPSGNQYRKYFIERPFGFNKLITEFLSDAKKIHCVNPECHKDFSIDDLEFLKFNNYKCNSCTSPVIVESISTEIKEKIERIDNTKLLPMPELKILRELEKSERPLYAREIAQEIDYSSQLVGRRGKKLEEEYDLVTRIKDSQPYKYELTEDGKKYFSE